MQLDKKVHAHVSVKEKRRGGGGGGGGGGYAGSMPKND